MIRIAIGDDNAYDIAMVNIGIYIRKRAQNCDIFRQIKVVRKGTGSGKIKAA